MNRDHIDNLSFSARPTKAAEDHYAGHRSADGLPLSNGQWSIRIRNSKSKIRNGFTLVEMLVAILILVVSVALIVGVGSMVRENTQNEETKNIQAVLRSALKVYRDENPKNNTKTTKPWPAGDGKTDSTAGLLIALRKDQKARETLTRLPRQALSEDSTGREFVLDGFGNRMRYHQTGGLAGAPLLISNGADPNDPADDINSDVN